MEHFSVKERSCRCGCGMDLNPDFRKLLNEIREEYGKPLTIVSGARCSAHNRKIGGAKKSAHIDGKAVDIRSPKDSQERLEFLTWIIARLDKYNLWLEDPDFTPSWVHIDRKVRLGTPRIFKPR